MNSLLLFHHFSQLSAVIHNSVDEDDRVWLRFHVNFLVFNSRCSVFRYHGGLEAGVSFVISLKILDAS